MQRYRTSDERVYQSVTFCNIVTEESNRECEKDGRYDDDEDILVW